MKVKRTNLINSYELEDLLNKMIDDGLLIINVVRVSEFTDFELTGKVKAVYLIIYNDK